MSILFLNFKDSTYYLESKELNKSISGDLCEYFEELGLILYNLLYWTNNIFIFATISTTESAN